MANDLKAGTVPSQTYITAYFAHCGACFCRAGFNLSNFRLSHQRIAFDFNAGYGSVIRIDIFRHWPAPGRD